jgi:hypothetical protein
MFTTSLQTPEQHGVIVITRLGQYGLAPSNYAQMILPMTRAAHWHYQEQFRYVNLRRVLLCDVYYALGLCCASHAAPYILRWKGGRCVPSKGASCLKSYHTFAPATGIAAGRDDRIFYCYGWCCWSC